MNDSHENTGNILMDYDERYSKVEAYFGTEEEDVLKQFMGRLKTDSVILDIGAGQGRNALFLSRQGFNVHVLEPSVVAIDALKQVVKNERLPMELFCSGFEQFNPPVTGYDGILVFGLIPDFTWSAINQLVVKIGRWSKTNTILWATGFTTQDPAYADQKAAWKVLGKNSFESSEGLVRTYLEPGQILKLFETFSVIHHWEGLGPEHRHGDNPPERHGKFEAVLLKT